MAYLYMLMAEYKVKKQEDLIRLSAPFDDNVNCKKAMTFGDKALKEALTEYNATIRERIRLAELEKQYTAALSSLNRAQNEAEYLAAKSALERLKNYKNSADLATTAGKRVEEIRTARLENAYSYAKKLYDTANTEAQYLQAAEEFGRVRGYKDADTMASKAKEEAEKCRLAAEEEQRRQEQIRRAQELKLEEERRVQELERQKQAKRKKAIKRTRIFVVTIVVLALIGAGILIMFKYYTSSDVMFKYYELENGEIEISDVNNFSILLCRGNVEIPKTLNGKKVTVIGVNAFVGCSNLTSVIIPDGVSHIDGIAFKNCNSLKGIIIPKSVKSIGFQNGLYEYMLRDGDGLFKSCHSLDEINYMGTKAEWNAISKAYNWNTGCPTITVHCTDGDVIED